RLPVWHNCKIKLRICRLGDRKVFGIFNVTTKLFGHLISGDWFGIRDQSFDDSLGAEQRRQYDETRLQHAAPDFSRSQTGVIHVLIEALLAFRRAHAACRRMQRPSTRERTSGPAAAY